MCIRYHWSIVSVPRTLDLQTINITLRILYRPKAEILPKIFTNLGMDYEERVLPSITNEVLKSVVVSDYVFLMPTASNRTHSIRTRLNSMRLN